MHNYLRLVTWLTCTFCQVFLPVFISIFFLIKKKKKNPNALIAHKHWEIFHWDETFEILDFQKKKQKKGEKKENFHINFFYARMESARYQGLN